MSAPLNITEMGFSSWLELYDWLRLQNLHTQEKVILTWQKEEEDRPDLTIHVNTIRAHAFTELYDKLPTKDVIEVIKDMIHGTGKSTKTELDLAVKFFDNLPTREI